VISAAFENFIRFWQGEAKEHYKSVMSCFEALHEQAIKEVLTDTFIPSLRPQIETNQHHESAKVIQEFIRALNKCIAEYDRLKSVPVPNAQKSSSPVCP
jgi:predicted secreted protein